MEVKYWVLSGVAMMSCTLFTLILRVWVNRLLDKLGDLNNSVTKLNMALVGLEKDTERNAMDVVRVERRLDNHAERIKKIEIKCG